MRRTLVTILALAASAAAHAAVRHAQSQGRWVVVGVEARPVAASLPATVAMDPGDAGALEIAFGFADVLSRRPMLAQGPPAGGMKTPSVEAPPPPATFRIRIEGRGVPIDVERRHAAPGRGSKDTWQELTIPLPPGTGSVTCKLSVTGPRSAEAVFALPLARTDEPDPRRALLVVLDTLRADRLSAYGYPSALSPHLDRLSRGGTTWSTCLATSNWTLPSHGDIFTGLRPFEHGLRQAVHRAGPMDPGNPSWVGLLRERNVETLALTGGVHVAPGSGLERGFDRFRTNMEGMKVALRELVPWLSARPRGSFFLFFHAYDPHAPYAAKNDVKLYSLPGGHALSPGERTESPRYDDGVLGVDRAFGLLEAQLRRLALDRGTTIVVTADHGEHLGEDGLVGHGTGLGDPVLHVPLLARGPGVAAGLRSQLVELRTVGTLVTTALEGREPTMPRAPYSVASELERQGLRLATPDQVAESPGKVPMADIATAYAGFVSPGLGIFVSRDACRRGLTIRLGPEVRATASSVWPASRNGGGDAAAGILKVTPGDGAVSLHVSPLPPRGAISIQLEPAAGEAPPALRLGRERKAPPASGATLDDLLLTPGEIEVDEAAVSGAQVWVVGVPEAVPSRAIPLDDEAREQMKALGYLN